jgi:hypothetical protein
MCLSRNVKTLIECHRYIIYIQIVLSYNCPISQIKMPLSNCKYFDEIG